MRQSAKPVMLHGYGDMLAEAFAGTSRAWRSYEQLEPTFTCTIRELLDVCRAVVG